MGEGSSQVKFASFFVRIDKDCVDITVWSSNLVANYYILFFYTILAWDSDEVDTVFDILETLKSEASVDWRRAINPFI